MRKYAGLLFAAFVFLGHAPAWAQSVLTYHQNTLRDGWNAAEKTLNVANVGGGSFQLQATATLDSQVDAQPLVVPNQTISGQGTHTVVYVATGGDTLYAIDGSSGAILLSRNFGTPIPRSALPGGCPNNGPTIGILSTPVINTSNGTMYLIADTYENGAAVYRVHAVSLSTLQDKVTPVVVTASAKLADGTSYVFDANVERQRPALLLAGGTLVAGFGSYCDQATNLSRGWLLGWTAATLAPLAHNRLQDSVSTANSDYFLNAIWMSGFGPSTTGANSPIYFVTSNSDKTTYGSDDLDESVLKVSPTLSANDSFYTDPNHALMDSKDQDFGSGGAMLTPTLSGEDPRLLFAAGKPGTMVMFNASTVSSAGLLATYTIGKCWCGPAFFTASDGTGRLVSSGGTNLIIWKVNTSASAPASLTQLSSTAITSGQDPGFFTTISSNGSTAGSAVIWAVGRPPAAPGTLPLYAIDPATGHIIYTATAGNWEYGIANANTVPTVANGHVYVASYQELAIFGLGAPAKPHAAGVFAAIARAAKPAPGFELAAGQHAIWGTIQYADNTQMLLKTRSGGMVWVAIAAARDAGNLAATVVGEPAVAIGRFGADGVLVASNVEHSKAQQALWPQDQ
jgi:hypothetical protein